MVAPHAKILALVGIWITIGLAVLLGSEVPCGGFPLCPVSTTGLWAGLFFFALALVSGAIGALSRRGRSVEPPPTD